MAQGISPEFDPPLDIGKSDTGKWNNFPSPTYTCTSKTLRNVWSPGCYQRTQVISRLIGPSI